MRDEFGAGRVLVFGSLLPPRLFHERSDVDLAVWGLDERRSFRHIVRNVYTFNLCPGRLTELVAGLGACQTAVARDLSEFAALP